MEKIIEKKSCKKCSAIFSITNKDLEFYNKISPVFDGKKYEIPSPNFCPDCRQQRRLSFRNERKLYKRKCDFSGKEIISIYSPDKNIKVYNQDFWWSDKWNALDYGMKFDFDKSFFEQFNELMKKVPVQSINNKLVENCDFTNECVHCKDCYMIFNSVNSSDSINSYILRDGDKCLDTAYCDKCFNSYELLECGGNSHNLFFSLKTSKSKNSYFLYNCIKCENCIGCVNLIDKKYCIFNKQYNENSYFIEKEKLFKNGFNFIEQKYKEILNKSPRNYMIGYANENVYGDNIFFSKNCIKCYDSNHLEDCKYIYTAMEVKDSYDIYLFGKFLELSYESISIGEKSGKILFSNSIINSYNILYSKDLIGCKNCFGCIGLNNKEYCILNKQYTKEKYNILVSKIIEHMKKTQEWGEFFPSRISLFGYNETVAQEYFPLEKEEIINHNFNYSNYESPFPKVKKIIPAKKLPQNISEIPDDILNWAIKCEITGKPFKIIKQELEFYKKHNLGVPRKHPDQRHKERINLRNPRKLFDRKCDKCNKKIKTTYSPDKNEIVICEECYNKEVY